MSLFFNEDKSKEFYDAASEGNLAKVKSLSLDPEVDLNWKDFSGRTPFFWACTKGHVDIVRYLLDFHDNQRPIEYNLADCFRSTPLSSACGHDHEEVVQMLVGDERIDLNRPNSNGETPLYWISYSGHVGIVKKMLSSTTQIDTLKKDQEGKTAADVARELRAKIMQGHWESEEGFQQRKTRYLEIESLIESYEKDPQAARRKLRRELGIDERMVGELFALVILLSDRYLKIPAETQGDDENAQRRKKAQRFFKLASSLPMDLQMELCNRVFGLGDSIVKKVYSEQGFKKFARE